MIGQIISHYNITAKLGEGGMGVVFRAEDLKLRRTVALKFLRGDLIESAEGKERFLREAQAAAALDHPNICTVHEIDEAGGQTFLAMAFVEGRSVKDKIAERPLKLDEALEIAIQTAQGLQAAHEKGVVHRDIKPANLIVNPLGQVKIMDFGLAHLADRTRLTQTAMSIGTPAYMSPEQAQRLDAGARSDIWSLGVVLYEMVTGQLPFAPTQEQALLYAIVHEEPEPVTARRAGLPLDLDRILAKALAKNPLERYQHVDDMAVDLRTLRRKVSATSAALSPYGPSPARHALDAQSAPVREGSRISSRRAGFFAAAPSWKRNLPWTLFAVSTAAAVALAFLYLLQPDPVVLEAPLRRFAVTTRNQLSKVGATGNISISPDGRHLAYATIDGSLWVQSLERFDPVRIERVNGAHSPFWSPDSEQIGFQEGAEIRRVSVRQGIPAAVCSLPNRATAPGAAWSPDAASIVFGIIGEGIYTVPARGGMPEKIFDHKHAEYPSFVLLPDGRTALLFATMEQEDAGLRHQIRLLVPATNEARVVTSTPSGSPHPFYSPTGHIVYVDDSSGSPYVWALPFSLASLSPVGEAFPIAGPGHSPEVSSDGTLVYIPAAMTGEREVIWVDRRGEKAEATGLVGLLSAPVLSPDQRFIAYRDESRLGAREAEGPTVWVFDLARKTRTPLTGNSRAGAFPVWSPDGQQIAFSSVVRPEYLFDIVSQRADGGGPQAALVATEAINEAVSDWSLDGRFLLYTTMARNRTAAGDIGYLERNPDGRWEPHAFLRTAFDEAAPMISPDGRYVAYESDESGRIEVYVQPFPQGGGRVTVSNNGGGWVRWRRDGKELFYVQDGALVAVRVSTAGDFTVGEPERLFEHIGLRNEGRGIVKYYDVSADGQRFLLTAPVDGADRAGTPSPSIHVVTKWFTDFQDRQRQ